MRRVVAVVIEVDEGDHLEEEIEAAVVVGEVRRDPQTLQISAPTNDETIREQVD